MSDQQPELSIEEELALAFAKRRTGGDVYMDGSHNPLPTERRDAADFVKYHVAPIQDALRGAAIELQLFHDLGTIAADQRDWAIAVLREGEEGAIASDDIRWWDKVDTILDGWNPGENS